MSKQADEAGFLSADAREHLETLLENLAAAVDWVALRGDGRMSLLEANALAQEKCYDRISDNISVVADALRMIACQMDASRRAYEKVHGIPRTEVYHM